MRSVIPVLSLIFAAVILWFFINPANQPLKYTEGDIFAQAGKLLSALFVTALFLERSVSIVNNIVFGRESNEKRAKVLLSSAADLESAYNEFLKVEDKKQKTRLVVSYLAGIMISAAGPRTLGAILNTADMASWTSGYKTYFYMVDILLTAGLIAGGSDGIAELIAVLKNKTTQLALAVMRR